MKYDYKCGNCATIFETDLVLKQVMDRKHRVRCPKCGHIARKLINKPAPIFYKTGGFYSSDNKKEGKREQG